MIKRILRRIVLKIGILLSEISIEVANKTLPKFGNNPKNLRIDLPRRIINPEYMLLGDNIYIGPGSLLTAIKEYPSPVMKHPDRIEETQKFDPRIYIGNRVTATGNLQIAAMKEIIIEDDVMFATNVNITDGFHGYAKANEPYKYQKMWRIAPIHIKRGCWIGQNVVILPGVTIGEYSIIGANSVVNKNIPDHSIAVGSPAKVIKIWDETLESWVKINE